MLERAKGCLEHNGLRLFRLRSEPTKIQRLRYAFWSHGAEDIELPGWWADLLSRSAQEEKEKGESATDTARRYIKAGFTRGHFLDFLYPARTQSFMRNLTARARRNETRSLTNTVVSHAEQDRSNSDWRDLDADEGMLDYLQHPEGKRNQPGVLDGFDGLGLQGPGDHDLGGALGRGKKVAASQTSKSHQLSELRVPRIMKKGRRRRGRYTGGSPSIINRLGVRHTGDRRRLNVNLSMVAPWASYRSAQERWRLEMQKLDFYTETIKNNPLFARGRQARRDLQYQMVKVYLLGRELVRRIEENILFELYIRKGIDNWIRGDWDVVFRIHKARNNFYDDRFLQAFDRQLALGQANTFMPELLRHLVRSDAGRGLGSWRFESAHRLCARYTTWRESAPSSVQQDTKPFWAYALDGNRSQRASMRNLWVFFKQMLRREPPSKTKGGQLTGEAMAHNFVGLAEIILQHRLFPRLQGHAILTFYDWVNKAVTLGPASYNSMHDLLKTFLFHHRYKGNKAAYTAVHAYHLYNAMDVHGGYRGEKMRNQPDLGRKLFWHLAYTDLTQYAVELFRNLEQRGVAYVPEYLVLRRKLAKQGNISAMEELATRQAAAEDKLRNRSPELLKQLQIPRLFLYRDWLEAYRLRVDLEGMLSVFDKVQNDPDVEADTYMYNLMISGFSRNEDLDGAQMYFQKMVDAGLQPDVRSFVPMLRPLARRGDVEAIRAITVELERWGIAINDMVVNMHVYALLQRGLLDHAEQLVWKSLSFKLEDRTTMWNYLLLEWALRGHRRKVNLLMAQMRRNGIRFDEFTFACRMQMWLVRKSPRRAWSILFTRMPKLGLRPLPFHFALMIHGLGGYSTGGTNPDKNLPAIQKVYRHMLKIGVQPDWNVMVAMSRALTTNRVIKSPRQALQFFKDMVGASGITGALVGPTILSRHTDSQYEVFTTGLFDFIFQIARQKRVLDRFDEVWDIYTSYIKKTKSGQRPFNPPVRILTRMMTTFHKMSAYGEVKKCWDSILAKADQGGRLSDGTIIPARRGMLVSPLRSYLVSLYTSGASIETIKSTVMNVLKRGFELDNRCWNLYVRLLCVAGPEHHLLAFETAEEQVFHGPTFTPHMRKIGYAGIRALIAREAFDKRSRRASSYRRYTDLHYPFRMETSIGKGLDTKNYMRIFRGQKWRAMKSLKLDPAAEDLPTSASRERLQVDLQDVMEDFTTTANQLRENLHEEGQQEGEEEEEEKGRKEEAAPEAGMLMHVPAYNREGSFVRRPEYTTVVYMARVYLQLRKNLVLDPEGHKILRELHMKATNTLKLISDLPITRDADQRSIITSRRMR